MSKSINGSKCSGYSAVFWFRKEKCAEGAVIYAGGYEASLSFLAQLLLFIQSPVLQNWMAISTNDWPKFLLDCCSARSLCLKTPLMPVILWRGVVRLVKNDFQPPLCP